MDLFDAAVAEGRVTICPPAMAAGHKPLSRRKKRKGEQIRPCSRCGEPVKYVKSSWAAYGKRRCGWHWVNEDGAHHRCGDFRQLGQDTLAIQWSAAMERDKPLGAAPAGSA